jgi:hypothetical protein
MNDKFNYLNSINYKIGNHLYELFNYLNHNNILLYGVSGTGKTYLIKSLLFDDTIIDVKKDHFKIEISKSNYYIDCNSITNKIDFITFIKDVTLKKDHNEINKYIVLDNYQSVNENIQNSLKVIIEKSYLTSKFIFITNNLSKVIKAIQSRFQTIRFPSLKTSDKYIYIKNNFNQNIIYNDCKNTSLKNLIYYHDKKYDKLRYFIDKIKEIFTLKINFEMVQKIKLLSCEIKEINLPIKQVFTRLIYDLKYDNQIMIQIINIISEYEYNTHFSYRDIIYIESLIINLYKVINDI